MTPPRTFTDVAARAAKEVPAPPTDTPQVVPAPTPVSDEVIDPASGEIVALDDAPTTLLAELVLECQRREQQLADWRDRATLQLVDRLKTEGHRRAVVGNLELEYKAPRSREWDPDELQVTLTNLIEDGIVQTRDVTDVLKRKVEVSGTAALRVLGQLTGEPHDRLEACFTWKTGKPKLTITPVPDLADALPK